MYTLKSRFYYAVVLSVEREIPGNLPAVSHISISKSGKSMKNAGTRVLYVTERQTLINYSYFTKKKKKFESAIYKKCKLSTVTVRYGLF